LSAADGGGPLIIIACGGTGGHVYPGMALAEEIRSQSPESRILFVGCTGGLEERVVPVAGWELKLLPSVKSAAGFRKLLLPLKIFQAMWAALKLNRENKPSVVVAMGGYASFAPALAARMQKIPLVVLEQNAIAGRVSKFLSRFATEVHATYEESINQFRHPDRVKLSGNPVRRKILASCQQAREKRANDDDHCKKLLIFGGSQGARRLNQLALEACKILFEKLDDRLTVTHLTGRAHYQAVRQAAEVCGLQDKIQIQAYEEDMGRCYGSVDLVLCRSGATGLSELAACSTPAVLVPFPYAKDNHQEANARTFCQLGAATLIDEGSASGQSMADVLFSILGDSEKMLGMIEAMSGAGRPEAAAIVASSILELCSKKEQ
jgi:UDP-N-acetylglucosamine--N-acetylmuramyl-(pentapeptide) pyrophosphoryl-undecaprenol N-acetylglucosamine transferase